MRKVLSIITVLLMSLSVYSQTDSDKQESSLIVAFDTRSRVNNYSWSASRVASGIDNILSRNHIVPDYVSGVLYGIRQGSSTPTGFSRLIVEPSRVSNGYVGLLATLHSNIPIGTFFSITSFAKPYSLMALKDKQFTNRTFMIVITDGNYNGNDDYYGEASYVKNGFSEEGKSQFKNDIRNVQTNYFCQFIDQMPVNGGYMQLYEFIPLQQYFALESVLDFPHELVAERTKSNYTLRFPTKIISNDDYEIQKLELSLIVGDGVLLTQEMQPAQEITLNISKEDIDKVHIEIKAWVKLCDGVYNNTILHPHGSKLQGSSGLFRTIAIQKEKNAEILGVIELPDFLFAISFWTSSQFAAAYSWGWIIIFIVLAIVVYAIYKTNIYKVKAGTTKI